MGPAMISRDRLLVPGGAWALDDPLLRVPGACMYCILLTGDRQAVDGELGDKFLSGLEAPDVRLLVTWSVPVKVTPPPPSLPVEDVGCGRACWFVDEEVAVEEE